MAAEGIRIGVLAASGLLGHALVQDLQRQGYDVVAVARRFTAAQSAAHRTPARTLPLVDLHEPELAAALADFDVVVNCLGILQDSPGNSTDSVHVHFTARLMRAVRADTLVIHISLPQVGPDATTFSRSKRSAEGVVALSKRRYLILRPGFVLADAAFGGSALMRALSSIPLALPVDLAATPFAVTDTDDIAATVAYAADSHGARARVFADTWDVLSDTETTVGTVLDALRRHLGGPRPRVTAPRWLLRLGALAGDGISVLGWVPPIRSTALAEMSRGVSGNPAPWRDATGIRPRSLPEMLTGRPATIQERWFGRLFLLKPLVIASLSLFWILTGLITLLPSFGTAVAMLVRHDVSPAMAGAVVVLTSVADIVLGIGIGMRRSNSLALAAGLALSALYVVGSLLLAPELWLDPLGAMLKTVPIMILMLVALAISDNR